MLPRPLLRTNLNTLWISHPPQDYFELGVVLTRKKLYTQVGCWVHMSWGLHFGAALEEGGLCY